ncbi:MAG: RNase adapter RapZ [Acidimicrobiia bacterium]
MLRPPMWHRWVPMTPPTPPKPQLDLTIITGLSGAGKSQTANALEDLGYFVIDNLPAVLLPKMAELARDTDMPRRQAVVVDIRSTGFVDELAPALVAIRDAGVQPRVVFLDAADDVLIRRFEGTRRPHPLAEGELLSVGIARERALLEPIRESADIVVDTSEFSLPNLREHVRALFAHTTDGALQVRIMSFGYKHGLPLDADVVLDCRFLANPHWDETLRPMSGLDTPVRDVVLAAPEAQMFVTGVSELLAQMLPAYGREGKSYLTVALGCTGGRHRSVVMATEVARLLEPYGYTPAVSHRDIDRA